MINVPDGSDVYVRLGPLKFLLAHFSSSSAWLNMLSWYRLHTRETDIGARLQQG